MVWPCAAAAEVPRARVEGALPAEIAKAIRSAAGAVAEPARNRLEARRRAAAAEEDVVTLLRSEGFYGYDISADVTGETPPTGVLKVDPGPRFQIAAPTVVWEPPEPVADARAAADAALNLPGGVPARSADIVAAEGRAVASLRELGYADAAAAQRRVVVDHATAQVRPTFHLAAGARVRLDGVRLEGRTRTRRGWLLGLAPWRAGETYTPARLAELEERLLDTGVYQAVNVALSPPEDRTAAGLRPVVVSLTDAPLRRVDLGVNYATQQGAGVEGRWTRSNLLGRADTLQLTGRLGAAESRLGASFRLPHWRGARRELLLGVETYRLRTDAYDETGAGARASITRRTGETSYRSLGAALDYSEVAGRPPGARQPLGRELATASAFAEAYLDHSDDPLDPRRGWRVLARAEPTVVAGDRALPYVRLSAQASTYRPLGAESRTVLAARLHAGILAGATLPDLPAPRRLYAGGGGSVRGLPYQAVGPRLSDGSPRGGLSLLEASFEVRQQITARWGVVAFLDAGVLGGGRGFDLGDPAAGAGVGLRYDLGFGPLRVDIAAPLAGGRGSGPQIYLSIGQSF